MITRVVLAKLSPTMEEGTIVKWSKKEGDVINVEGFGAKNGTNTGNAASVTLASTGELLWASVPRAEQK